MNTSEKLRSLLALGFEDENSLIKQEDIEKIEAKLSRLEAPGKKEGYTIPQLDTVGMNLEGGFACKFENL